MGVRLTPQRSNRQRPSRQQWRRAFLLGSFLLFPASLNYFSPYVIIDGASQGIVNGSFVVFALLFFSSLFFGRLWCAWGCPAGGLQDWCATITNKPASGGKLNWLKWGIWIPWIGGIAAAAVAAGGYRTINLLHLTESGISVDEPMKYATYYTVVGLFVVLPLIFGRRASCHYVCWMAPFMVLGRRLRHIFAWPSLRLVANPGKCGACQQCTRGCPMSLAVHRMVRAGMMECGECILCGTCVDNCPKGAIRYTFSPGR